MKIENIQVNHITNNRIVESKSPVISWEVTDAQKNSLMKSFSICIEHNNELIWKSGEITDHEMTAFRCEDVPILSDEKYNVAIKVEADADGVTEEASGSSFFETGWLKDSEKKVVFIGEVKEKENHIFVRNFECTKKIQDAKLYVCGLGHFVFMINGKKATGNVLEPGWSDYTKRCFYVAYDVTEQIAEGYNNMLFRLGGGMFYVPESEGRYVYYPRSYGLPKLWARLRLTFEDGSKEFIETGSDWKQVIGPDIYQEMYGGVCYDSRLFKRDYIKQGLLDTEYFEDAPIVKPPEGRLVATSMEPTKVMESIAPVEIYRNTSSTWMIDFGTNFSGWARIKVRGKNLEGKAIVMRPGELTKKIDEGVTVDQHVTGENYAWTYILNDENEQEYAPDFTYTGFRYLEIKGAVPSEYADSSEDLPVIEQIFGEFIYPDFSRTGKFICSNELFNRIHGIVRQAILSNTKSYFTDCPHRERLGWLEQTHLIGPSIMYNFDVHNLYRKIEQDMADSQNDNGLVPDICPEYVTGFGKWHQGFVDSPEWGSACILDAWYVYRRYGDIDILRDHYDTMTRYLNYLTGKSHHKALHHGLGDWLDIGPNTPNSQNTPVAVVATCIYYLDVQIMEQIADLLGNEQDRKYYAKLGEEIYTEYRLQFYDDQTGRYATGSQAAQAMSLMAGLVGDEYLDKVLKVLRTDIEKRDYAITAGDVGHPFLIAALMKFGMSDVINRMTNITDHPGYGYQVVNGATTLTEEWDGPCPDHPHGSQNHLMLGSIEEWFYGSLAGIEWIKGEGRWNRLYIKPSVQEGVDYVEACTPHPNGRVYVMWKRDGDKIRVQTEIPFGVKAVLCDFKGTEIKEVGCGMHEYEFINEEQ